MICPRCGNELKLMGMTEWRCVYGTNCGYMITVEELQATPEPEDEDG